MELEDSARNNFYTEKKYKNNKKETPCFFPHGKNLQMET